MQEDKAYLFEQLYLLTNQLNQMLHNLAPNMDENETEQVEELNSLMARRSEVIKGLQHFQDDLFSGLSLTEKKLAQLQAWEMENQELIQNLFESFSTQYQKLQRGKKLTQHYKEEHEPVYLDGVYIDKRK